MSSQLQWEIDHTTVNNQLFHINDDNIENQEIIINPVQDKNGQDDIGIILRDADGGIAKKANITIIVDSRIDKTDSNPSPEKDFSKNVSANVLIYILLLIIIIVLIIIFMIYRRRKKMQNMHEDIEDQNKDAKVEEEESETEEE